MSEREVRDVLRRENEEINELLGREFLDAGVTVTLTNNELVLISTALESAMVAGFVPATDRKYVSLLEKVGRIYGSRFNEMLAKHPEKAQQIEDFRARSLIAGGEEREVGEGSRADPYVEFVRYFVGSLQQEGISPADIAVLTKKAAELGITPDG